MQQTKSGCPCTILYPFARGTVRLVLNTWGTRRRGRQAILKYAYPPTMTMHILDIHSHSHRISATCMFQNMHSQATNKYVYFQNIHSQNAQEHAYFQTMYRHTLLKYAYLVCISDAYFVGPI
jgi:hypothetical protein